MILGTVLSYMPWRTMFGLEHTVKFDVNPAAKSASGHEGGAISDKKYQAGDRVVLEYRSGPAYGLWFIVGKQEPNG